MRPPARREVFPAHQRYYRSRLHFFWFKATGRCPQCSNRTFLARGRAGGHKFGCGRRPGKGLKISMRGE
jgi:ribosomal protein S27AE